MKHVIEFNHAEVLRLENLIKGSTELLMNDISKEGEQRTIEIFERFLGTNKSLLEKITPCLNDIRTGVHK